MMKQDNDHSLIKSAYLLGVLLLVIGAISAASLFFQKEGGSGVGEADRSDTNGGGLSNEEKRLIEERLSGKNSASTGTLLGTEKQNIEANFNKKTNPRRISPEEEMKH